VFQVVDLEARNWIDFIVGGYFDGKNYFEFRDLTEFTDYINESKKSLNIYAHFGGGYDFLFILNNLLENKIEVTQIIPRGSMILSISIKGKYKTHKLRDSCAILPFGLKKLTDNFDVETKKGEYDHSLNRGYNQELCDYLKDDCLGLYQVLQKYFNSPLIRKAGASATIASQAQKILRTYLKAEIHSLSHEVNEFCRLACIGGRTEIFKPLGKDLREYDANSLYPKAMRDNYYPVGKPIGTRKLKRKKLGIYHVKVFAPDNLHIPIVAVKKDKKLLFPLGEFETHITSVELEYAEKFGYKFEVIEGYYWNKKEKLFTEFITDLYRQRLEAGKGSVLEIICKLIMNSSSGKFNIKVDRENLVFDAEFGETPFRTIKNKLGNIEIFTKKVTLNTFVHSGISAFILAYARIHMMDFIQPIAHNVYYTDTDSIFTDVDLDSSTELGALKLERKYDEACFLLPKTYIAQNNEYKKVVMKGFDSRKVKVLSLNDFKMALNGESILQVKHDKKIAKFKTALQKNTLLLLKDEFTKQINSGYTKRTIDLLNNTSKPLVLTGLS
jgi:hypothetical protein